MKEGLRKLRHVMHHQRILNFAFFSCEIDEKKIDNYIPLRLRDQSEMAKFIQMDQDAVALRDQQRAAVQEEEEEVLLAGGGGGGGGNDSGDDEYIPGQNDDLD